MALTPNEESKSLRITSQTEDGKDVFSAAATYSRRGINVSFEMLDREYCAENRAEIQDAASAFLRRLNAALFDDGYIIVNASGNGPEGR